MTDTSALNDPLAFGRQLWQQWNAALQKSSPSPASMAPDWSSAAGQWSQWVGSPSGEAGRAAEKVGAFGQQFMGLMQELIQRASGSPTSAADLGAIWGRSMSDGNPLLDAMRQISTDGARGWEQMFGSAGEATAPMAKEWLSSMQLPGFGLGRERQARMGDMVAATAAHMEAVQGYQQLLKKASDLGMERFESKLAERSEPGRQVDSMRALYNLWIDAAEEAYAQVALSPEFRTAYAALVNSQMRVKQLQQQELERMAAEAGMPTRSELDGVLRRIGELQRDLREVRRQASGRAKPAGDASADRSVKTAPAAKRTAKPASQKATVKKTAAKRAAASKKVATKKVAARKATPKKTAPKKAAAKKTAVKSATPKKIAAKKTATRKVAAKKVAAKKQATRKMPASKKPKPAARSRSTSATKSRAARKES